MSTSNRNDSENNEVNSDEGSDLGHLVKGCVYCTKAQPPGQRTLRRCSRCKTAWYCSPECQKADWKIHREHCKSREQMRQEAGETDPDERKARREFEKWVSHHNPVLSLVIYRALRLQSDPDAFKSKGLYIYFEPKADRQSYPLHQRYNVVRGVVEDLDSIRNAAIASGAGGIEDHGRALSEGRRVGMLVLSCPPVSCHWQRAQLMTPEELREAAPIVNEVPEDWVPWLNKAVNENYVSTLLYK